MSDEKQALKVLACQIAIPSTATSFDRDKHLFRSRGAVQEAFDSHSVADAPSSGIDLVVLPELSAIDYSREAFEQLDDLAETDDGASFQCWSEFARSNRCHVLYGFARKKSSGFTISSAIVDQYGCLCGVYDKLHLAQFGDSMEKEYFSGVGDSLLVVEINGFRIAPIICYDIRAPELCRELVLAHHVDFIAHVGAYARDPSFFTWHAFATTRAVENQCYFLSLNRAGRQFGHSIFCGPWVDAETPAQEFEEFAEHFKFLELDRQTIDRARSDYTFLLDRLPGYQLPVTNKRKN